MKKAFTFMFVALVLMVVSGQAFGESYPNGAEGIKAATAPPPGVYWKCYNAYITSDDMRDPNGNTLNIDFEIKWFANVHRFIWVSKDIKIFGGDFIADLFIPVWHRDTKIGVMNIDDSEWQFGDIIIEPFALAWHGPQYDAVTAVAFFLPTAKHDAPSDPGEDMYTTMFTLGGTYYPDKAKTWSVSWLGRYEIHSQKRDVSDITPGDDFHFEWGVGKTLAGLWDVGIVGYCQWQVTEDEGTGVTNDKDEGHGVGPEISYIHPPWKCIFSLRSIWEYGVEGRATGRPKSNRTFLNITKIF